jgi:hypothetical protein
MATVNDRTSFKDYCLRRLGFPVIEINVDGEQIEDRIDDQVCISLIKLGIFICNFRNKL